MCYDTENLSKMGKCPFRVCGVQVVHCSRVTHVYACVEGQFTSQASWVYALVIFQYTAIVFSSKKKKITIL